MIMTPSVETPTKNEYFGLTTPITIPTAMKEESSEVSIKDEPFDWNIKLEPEYFHETEVELPIHFEKFTRVKYLNPP